MIAVENVGVTLGGKSIVEGVSFDVPRGSLVGLVGPNGAGKTTIVKAINGLLAPDEGRVEIDGDPMPRLSAREVSRRVATVPQDSSMSFEFPVRDVVAMGRTPHRSRFERESAADREAVAEALRRTQVAEFADRSIDEVSGGERQRVILARALCQRSPCLLLDEPTASLDIGHGVRILRLVRDLVSEGKAALAAIHDLDLAARFCDELVLLAEGEVLAADTPREVLTEAHLEAAFDVEVAVTPHPITGAMSVTALSDRPTRERSVHVLGGGQAGAAAIVACRKAGFETTAGPLLEDDVALARARAFGIEVTTAKPFAPITPAARREVARLVRDADVTVLASDREPYYELATRSERTVVLGEGSDATATEATTASATSENEAGTDPTRAEGGAVLDSRAEDGEVEAEERKSDARRRVWVANGDDLVAGIERVLDERDEGEN